MRLERPALSSMSFSSLIKFPGRKVIVVSVGAPVARKFVGLAVGAPVDVAVDDKDVVTAGAPCVVVVDVEDDVLSLTPS